MLEPIAELSFAGLLAVGAAEDARTRTVWSWMWWPHTLAGLWLGWPMGWAVAAVLGGASFLLNRLGHMGMGDVKAVVALALLFPESAAAVLAVALVGAAAWSRFDEEVPFLVPLLFGLLIGIAF